MVTGCIPAKETVIKYTPGGSAEKLYAPVSPLIVDRDPEQDVGGAVSAVCDRKLAQGVPDGSRGSAHPLRQRSARKAQRLGQRRRHDAPIQAESVRFASGSTYSD